MLGATDADMARFFKVTVSTFNLWKLKHPKFSEALKVSKDQFDQRVEISLAQRAIGYSHPEDKIFFKDGKVVTVETTKHYPPETTACIFWLKNRQPETWRDVREQVNKHETMADAEVDLLETARRLAFLITQGAAAQETKTQH